MDLWYEYPIPANIEQQRRIIKQLRKWIQNLESPGIAQGALANQVYSSLKNPNRKQASLSFKLTREVWNLSDFDLPFILSLSVSIIAVFLAYVDMRRRLKAERDFNKSMAKLVNTLREELELFRKQSKTTEDIERQKLLAQQGQQQWKQLTDIAKGIGWILEHAEDNEEEP